MLTRNDVIDILKAVAAGDRRTAGEADIILWRAALQVGGVESKQDALQAVAEHFAMSTDWLMPAHVVTRVKAIRRARVAQIDEADGIVPNVDPDDVPAFQAERRAILAAAADGEFDVEAYQAGGFTLTGAPPRRLAGDDFQARELAARVKAIGGGMRTPHADVKADGGDRPQREAPKPTVSADQAAAMEAERNRQLAALEAASQSEAS